MNTAFNYNNISLLKGLSYSTYVAETWPQAVKAQIVHVFSEAVSFALPSGELYCVALRDTQNLPHGIIVESPIGFDRLGLFPGMSVFRNESYLHFGDSHLAVDLRNAQPWNPYPEKMSTLCWIPENVTLAIENLKIMSSSKSFLTLIEGLDDLTLVQFIDVKGDIFLEKITLAISRLCSSIRLRNAENFLESSKSIIGLGTGLTPSGDDILLGMIAVLSEYDNQNNAPHWFMEALKKLTGFINGSTTIVSEAFLHHAINRRFPELLIKFIKSITGFDREKITKAVSRLSKFGSSSGCEMALGTVIALKTFTQRNQSKLTK